MKPLSNRPKSKEEQFLSDYLGKIGQGPGETGTIEVDAIAALGRIERKLDELEAQRDELRALLVRANFAFEDEDGAMPTLRADIKAALTRGGAQ